MMACDELEHDHMVALAMVRSAGFVSPKPYCLFCSQAPAPTFHPWSAPLDQPCALLIADR